MTAAALAALAAGEPRAVADEKVEHPKPTADTCILLWMAGGMAAPETFDPKRYIPFEVGVPARRRSSARSRPSTRPSTTSRSRQGLENIAKVMDRGTLIRSHVVADLGNILHSRHQYHWHTGYVPPQTVAAPHLGAWIAKVRGPKNPAIPAFINIGQRLEGLGEIGGTEGVHHRRVFRQRVRPVQLCPFPIEAVEAVRPPKGMTPGGSRSGIENYQELVEAARPEHGQRLSSGIDAAGDGQRPSAAQLAGPRGVRPVAGAEGELTRSTTPAGSAWAACSPAG